jgi:hypothetical protein
MQMMIRQASRWIRRRYPQQKQVARTLSPLCLDAQPTADVVFTVTSNDTSEGTSDVSTLTFTPLNWNTPQTITVTGADDTLIDGDVPYVVQVAVDTVNTLDANFATLASPRCKRHQCR